jgi:hypothetical protein
VVRFLTVYILIGLGVAAGIHDRIPQSNRHVVAAVLAWPVPVAFLITSNQMGIYNR